MKLRRWAMVVLGGLALAAGLTTGVGAQGQGQQNQEQTIVLYEDGDEGAFRFVDAKPFTRVTRRGPRRISPGDSFVVGNTLYNDAAHTQRGGEVRAQCTASNPSRRFERVIWLCHGVMRLTAGDITFEGVFDPSKDTFVFAVTGGTAGYEGAEGQVTIADQANDDSVDTIHLLGK